MKKVIAITSMLAALTMLTAVMVSAQVQPDWRFNIKSDDGAGMYSGSTTTIGVAAISNDGPTADANDVKLALARTATSKVVVSVFNSFVWTKDVKSNALPSAYPPLGQKIWDLRVIGLGNANVATPIRLAFTTISATMFPVSTVGGVQANYWLRMVDNKGVAGAYANGTVWSIPIPTVHSTTVPYFTLTLPTINVTSTLDANIISEGYGMQFYQTGAVPEPSSLLALGTGLMGLGGFFTRRRKS